MERLNNRQPEADKSAEPSELKIDVVRHGPSLYRQPDWRDIETADDLNALGAHQAGDKTPEEIDRGKEEAIALVRETAEKIADDISPDEEVIIWSSPTGRTLETARIISETLKERGIKLRDKGPAKERGVNVFEHIGEVRNFKWELFAPLIAGGEVDFNGIKFFIDKKLSNPENLGYPDYFTADAIKEIPAEIKEQWPAGYVKEIEAFESFGEVSQRMKEVLNRLKKIKDKNYRVIIVTHDSLTGALVKVFTGDQLSGVDPGQLVSLERVDDKLFVTRVGDITAGDNQTSVA